NAAQGDTLELLLGGSSFPTPITAILNATDITNTNHSFTIPAGQLGADGVKNITARVTDQAGNLGPASASPLTFTLDTTAPTASIGYSNTSPLKSGAPLTITATFSEPMIIPTPTQITLSGANTLSATAMTRTDATHYTFNHVVGAGNGLATVALSAGTDLAGNPITAAPTAGATF